mmetsp:Transcript_27414/g.31962  ORF Transcript_27414/g.31962 Transcript_27414/m.31962 type:complete len:306 (-) Transcript_27414:222-1139(-)
MVSKSTILIDQINTLCQQEEDAYKCLDYLSPVYQGHLDVFDWRSTESRPSSDSQITERWRDKICEWAYNMIDHFNYDRDLVAVTMNFLDRYAMERSVDRKTYQLAAMTCLFLVTKMHSSRSTNLLLDVSSLVKLSQDAFEKNDVLGMERDILHTLNWNLHPPTPSTFVTYLSELIPFEFSKQSHNLFREIIGVAQFTAELSVCDYFFVPKRSSLIAVASLLNAMDMAESAFSHVPSLRETFQERVKSLTVIDISSSELVECKNRLRCALIRGGHFQTPSEDETSTETGIPSPVNVAKTEIHIISP